MLQFAVGDHLTAQFKRCCCYGKTKRGEARQETHQAQHPQRVFGEGGRDMAQYARLHIRHATIGVNQSPVRRLRHRVNRQITAQQIRFQRYIRREIKGKGLMTASGLALLPRQRVFLARFGVQKHREILADLSESLRQHFFRRRANHDPIAVMHRQSQ